MGRTERHKRLLDTNYASMSDRCTAMQAVEAPCHRAQCARFGGRACVHRAVRPVVLVHAFPEAAHHAVEVTIKAPSSVVSDMSIGLRKGEFSPHRAHS